MNTHFLKLHPDDNVAISINTVEKKTVVTLDGKKYVCQEVIPRYFKMSVRDIPEGGKILKYGICIGIASKPIAAAELVHTHNMKSEYISSFTKNE